LDPADGPLDAGFATGLVYHSSGAGIALAPIDGGSSGGVLPGNGITLTATAGVPANVQYAGQYRPDNTDVYLLVDQSTSMAEETLWLYDAWDTNASGSPYLSASLPCTGGNQSLLQQGISGAFSCMFTHAEVG